MNQIYKLLFLSILSFSLYANRANAQTVTITSDPITQAICQGESITLTATAGGGAVEPIADYAWSSGQHGDAITVSPGATATYTVTMTDGAANTATADIVVTVNPLPEMTVSANKTICKGESVTLTANGATIIDYYWPQPASIPLASRVGPSITWSPANSTTATVIGSDGTCSILKNINVTVINITAEAGLGVPPTICNGATTTLGGAPTATGGGPYTYTWNNGAAAEANPVVNPAVTTTYSLTVTGANNCSATDNVTITVNAVPTANAGAPKEICEGNSTTIGATPAASGGSGVGYIYTWDNGAGAVANPSVSPVVSTTYTLNIQDSKGCTASDDVAVTVNPKPTIAALVDQTICLGDSYAVDANVGAGTPGFTYSWTPNTNITPDNTSEDVTLTPVVSTTYTLSVTDSKTCSASDNIAITVLTAPNANAGTDKTLCQGQSTTIDASASTGAPTFLWSPNDGSLDFNNIAAPTATPAASTTYTVTATNVCGFDTDDVVVTVYPSITIDLGADHEICSGDSYTIPGNVTGGTPAFTYTWNPTTNLSATNISNPSTSTLINRTYTVTVSDSHGCSDTDDIVITVNPKPTIDAGLDASYCAGGSHNIDATSGAGTPIYTYLWTPSLGLSDDEIEDPVANPAASTTYTVEITDSKGCSNTSNIIITVNETPVANAGPASDEICLNTAYNLAGTATLGTQPYTYTWDNGLGAGQNKSVTPLVNTTYTLTVEDNNGCTDTDEIEITVNPLPTADAGAVAPICSGETTALNGSGAAGTAPYTYSWSPGATLSPSNIANPNANPVASTTYTLEVTDSKGCTSTDDVVLTVKTSPTVTMSKTDPSACNLSDGDATATVTAGGSGNYSYAWNPAGATQTISGLSDGIYQVTVTDNISLCTGTGSITLNDPTLLSTTLGSSDADNTICAGASVTFTANAVGATGYEFYVNGVSVQGPGAANTYTTSGLTNGQQVTARGYDALCSDFSDPITTTVNPIPNADAGVDKIICNGSSTTLTASGGGTYLWSDAAGATASVNVSPVATKTYTVTVTLNGCTETDDATVTVNDKPNVSAGLAQEKCFGLSANLSASGAQDYEWSTGELTQNITVTPAATTTYTVTGTDLNTCTNTSSVVVTINPNPTASAGANKAFCAGDNVSIGGAPTASGGTGPGYTYAWDNGAAAIANPSVSPGINTTYTVTVTDSKTCTGTASVEVTVNAVPTVDAGNNTTICEGSNTQLGAIPTANGGLAPYIYTWDNGLSGSNPFASPANTTTYKLTVTDDNTCTASDQVVITVQPAPVANAGGNQSVCSGSNYTLVNATATNDASIAWTTSGDGSFTDNTDEKATYVPGATDISNGSVVLTMTVTGTAPCLTDIDFMTLSIDPLPTAAAGGSQTICVDGTATVAGASSSNGTISWAEDGAGSITAGANTLTPTYTPAAGDAGNTVTLTMTVTSTNACAPQTATATYSVIVDPLPLASAGGSQTICVDGTATVIGAAASNGTISWAEDGAGSITAGANTLTPTYTPAAGDAGNTVTLTMTVTSTNNCAPQTATATYTVIVKAIPTAAAGGSQTICVDGTATVSGASSSNGTISWAEDGAGSITAGANTLTPTYTPAAGDAGNTVTLTMTVANAPCVNATATYTVIVEPLPVATAGGSQTICVNSTATVAGAAASNGTISWAEDGAGSITAGANTLTPTYTPAAGDAGNTVTLTMTVTSNNICAPQTATAAYTVVVDPLPTASAGGSMPICVNSTGMVSGASATNGTIAWTEDGAGSITAGVNTLTPTYTPAPGDAGNTVTLTMTVTSNNACNPQTATATYTMVVDPLPTASAGGSQTICSNGTATVSGAASTNGTIAWAEDGAGSITAGANTLTPTYTAAAGDAGNTVTLTMTVTSNNACAPQTATAIYTVVVDPLPTASAGGSQTICSNGTATVAGAASSNGTIAWTENGAGSITAGANTLTPTYTAAAGDAGNTVTLTMTVTSNNSCAPQTATAAYSVVVEPLPTATAGGSQNICVNGTATVSGANATNGTIAWTENGAGSITAGANTLTPTYTPAAGDAGNTVNLTMTVTSNNSCAPQTATAAYTVIVEPLPTASAGGSQTICSNGTATVAGAASTNGTIAWTENGAGSITAGANTLTPTYTAAAGDAGNTVTLTMTVTSNNSCTPQTATATYFVVVEPLPTAIAGGSQTICVNGTATVIGANATNGTIAWTENGAGSITAGANTLTPTYTPAAGDAGNTVTLTMTVTSNNSCAPQTATANYTVIVNGIPTASAGGSQTICVNSTATVSGAAATNGTILWTEDGAGTITAGANTLTPTYTPAPADAGNTVTLTMTVANAPCVNATATYTVIIEGQPTAAAGGSQTICVNGTATVSGASATNGTISWAENGAGSITAGANTLTPTYTPAAGDEGNTVTLTMTVTSINSCAPQTATANYTVTVNPLPTAIAGGSQTICISSTATVSGASSSNGTIAWTENGAGSITAGANTLTPVYTPAAGDAGNAVNLIMTVTSNNACAPQFTTANYTVNVVGAPTANAGPDVSTCFGPTTINAATASNEMAVTWVVITGNPVNLSNANTLSPTYTPTAGETTVVLTMVALGNAPCSNASDQVIINYVLPPVVNAGSDAATCAATAKCISDAVATNANVITWSTTGDGLITNGNTTSPCYTPGPTDITNGFVTLQMDATGFGSCPNAPSDVMTLTVNTLPVADAGADDIICPGTSKTLNATGAGIGGSYDWSGNQLSAPTNIFNPVATPTVTSTYTVSVVDTHGCSDTDDVVIAVFNTTTPTITPDNKLTYCVGEPINVTFTAAPATYNSYEWRLNGSAIVGETNTTYIANGAGTYNVYTQDANGCFTLSAPLAIAISQPNPQLLYTGDTIFCEGDHSILYLNTPFYNYTWSSGSNTSTIKVQESGIYSVTVVDQFNCVGYSDSLQVVVDPYPNAYFGYSDNLLSVNFYDFSDFATSVSWDFGDGSAPVTGANPTHNFPTKGTYNVQMTVTNGCSSDTYSMLITLTDIDGISESESISKFEVYPNPANDYLYLDIESQINQEVNITLRNELGQIISNESIQIDNNEIHKSINVSTLPTGMYLLQVQTSKGVVGRRVIIF